MAMTTKPKPGAMADSVKNISTARANANFNGKPRSASPKFLPTLIKKPMTTSPFPPKKPVAKMAKGGKISEYGGKEMYKSKSAMMKHEGSESMAMERKERKMAMGGKCRGMGAATKGGNYKG